MSNEDDPGPAGEDTGAADEPPADTQPAGDDTGAADEPAADAEPVADTEPADEPTAESGGRGADGPGPDEQYCSSCGEIIKQRAEICPHCGVRNRPAGGTAPDSSKDRVTAGVLAILLGWFGAHKFYLGDTGLGILYLCFFWTGIPAIVGLIEGILYLTKTDEEFQQAYVD